MSGMIADTGPIVALLDRTDFHHEWALETYKSLHVPLLTCEAVLAEAWHLLARSHPARETLAALHQRGIIRSDFDFETEANAVWRLVSKYADISMDLQMPALCGWRNCIQVSASGRSTPTSPSTGSPAANPFNS
jgi:predicted nucleic acid-binding protein